MPAGAAAAGSALAPPALALGSTLAALGLTLGIAMGPGVGIAARIALSGWPMGSMGAGTGATTSTSAFSLPPAPGRLRLPGFVGFGFSRGRAVPGGGPMARLAGFSIGLGVGFRGGNGITSGGVTPAGLGYMGMAPYGSAIGRGGVGDGEPWLFLALPLALPGPLPPLAALDFRGAFDLLGTGAMMSGLVLLGLGFSLGALPAALPGCRFAAGCTLGPPWPGFSPARPLGTAMPMPIGFQNGLGLSPSAPPGPGTGIVIPMPMTSLGFGPRPGRAPGKGAGGMKPMAPSFGFTLLGLGPGLGFGLGAAFVVVGPELLLVVALGCSPPLEVDAARLVGVGVTLMLIGGMGMAMPGGGGGSAPPMPRAIAGDGGRGVGRPMPGMGMARGAPGLPGAHIGPNGVGLSPSVLGGGSTMGASGRPLGMPGGVACGGRPMPMGIPAAPSMVVGMAPETAAGLGIAVDMGRLTLAVRFLVMGGGEALMEVGGGLGLASKVFAVMPGLDVALVDVADDVSASTTTLAFFLDLPSDLLFALRLPLLVVGWWGDFPRARR
mmetsp:Transcript_31474/g.99812  ORF Transcript_31474/g.99812 Transcript_31474/m.99812 type:complete len:550 (-) Transcript_31474:82-1731(-)